jgi:hypothetical protein
MAPHREGLEEGLGLRAGVPEAIAAAELVGVALLGDKRGEVGVVFDALLAIVAAGVGATSVGPSSRRTVCSDATRVSGRRINVWGIE